MDTIPTQADSGSAIPSNKIETIQRWIYVNAKWFMLVILIIGLAFWWLWAVPWFYTSNSHSRILELVTAAENLNSAQRRYDFTILVIKSGIQNFTNPVNELDVVTSSLRDAQGMLEIAGGLALPGELIILSGMMLQITTTLGILYIFSQILTSVFDWLVKDDTKEQALAAIRRRKLLSKEDNILKFIRDEKKMQKEIIRLRGSQVAEEYRKLLERPLGESEEPEWSDYSKILYKMFLLCNVGKAGEVTDANSSPAAKKSFEDEIWKRYSEIRGIIRRDLVVRSISSWISPAAFVAIFWIGSEAWNARLNSKVIGTLGNYMASWQTPVMLIGLAVLVAGVIHEIVAQLAYWLTEKTWSDLDDIIVSMIVGPLSAALVAALGISAIADKGVLRPGGLPRLNDFAAFFTWLSFITTKDEVRSIILITVLTWLGIFFLNNIIVWSLEKWAKRTEQIYDDVFVMVVQVFGTFIILAFGIGAALAVVSGPLRESTGIDNVILPYSIVVSVFTGILGLAMRAGIENFFGGLLIQIEKPFKSGEQIQLPNGQICDVRNIGMRSTTLYNVLENTEVSVPNAELARMTITNLSRPELELRIAIPVWVAESIRDLKKAESILLDIAYLDEEVDKMRLTRSLSDENEGVSLAHSRRSTVMDEFARIYTLHDVIHSAQVSRVTGVGRRSQPRNIFALNPSSPDEHPYAKVIENIRKLREEYDRILEAEEKWINQAIKINWSDQKTKPDFAPSSLINAIYEAAFSERKWGTDNFKRLAIRTELHEGLGEGQLTKIMEALAGIHPVSSVQGTNPQEKVRGFLEMAELRRRGIILGIQEQRGILIDFVFAIGNQFPSVRADLDILTHELNMEPTVLSEYQADGSVKLTLLCFVMNSQRKASVADKLNAAISIRFRRENVDIGSRTGVEDNKTRRLKLSEDSGDN